ncbi:hypothetical protein N0V94_003648 [Neodidymelliopsis sp. IMI 364377]|nr:hypothetical protein N0V94_003648 [Neodidymelliopsis sp. IMI 364377]
MNWRSYLKVARWVKKYDLQLEPGNNARIADVPRKAIWRFASKRMAPVFDGFFQLQHLTIVVKIIGDYIIIPVKTIIEDPACKCGWTDVDHNKISFARLQLKLEEAANSTYEPATHIICYKYPNTDNDAMDANIGR